MAAFRPHIGQSTVAVTTGATPVTVLAAPVLYQTRRLAYLSVFNADTVVQDVTLQLNDDSTIRRIKKQAALAVGASFEFDKPIMLDTVDKTLEIVLGGAVTTNELEINVSFRDEK